MLTMKKLQGVVATMAYVKDVSKVKGKDFADMTGEQIRHRVVEDICTVDFLKYLNDNMAFLSAFSCDGNTEMGNMMHEVYDFYHDTETTICNRISSMFTYDYKSNICHCDRLFDMRVCEINRIIEEGGCGFGGSIQNSSVTYITETGRLVAVNETEFKFGNDKKVIYRRAVKPVQLGLGYHNETVAQFVPKIYHKFICRN